MTFGDQARNDLAIEERPSRLAVHEQNGIAVAGALIDGCDPQCRAGLTVRHVGIARRVRKIRKAFKAFVRGAQDVHERFLRRIDRS